MKKPVNAAGRPKKGLSEAQLAWLLMAPALLVIFAIALFPVLRTFYLSLFDLRLNHPTKNTTQLSYQLNVNRFADANYRLEKSFKANLKTETGTVADELKSISADYDSLINQVLEGAGLSETYQQVWDLQAAMKPVPEELQVKGFTGADADKLSDGIKQCQDRLYTLQAQAKDGKSVKMTAQIYDDIAFSMASPNFVGLENYTTYFQDMRMWSALKNTVMFAAFAVSFELVLGIGIALLMNRNFRGRGLVRATVLVPWAIPAAVSALTWRFMYDGQYGIVAMLFEKIGFISSAGVLLTDGSWSMFGLIFADIWKTSPYMSLLLLAGLQSVDTSLYEAAEVDGANQFQKFFKITLPLLKPSILVAVIFRSMDALRVFDLVSVMTNGGPANGTEVITLYAYKTMFGNMMFGAGSALSVIIFILLAIFCVSYIKLLNVDLVKIDR